jgi:hypothetical protein
VQFYFQYWDRSIHMTGNAEWMQRIMTKPGANPNTTVPDIEFWTDKNYIYHYDDSSYTERFTRGVEGMLSVEEVMERYEHRQTVPFKNHEWWYLLKFLFIASWFQNMEGTSELIGEVPASLPLKCPCGELVEIELHLKGILKLPEEDYRHDYYLYIGHQCTKCGKTVCIYRPKQSILPLLTIFVDTESNAGKRLNIEDLETAAGWQRIFKKAVEQDQQQIEKSYRDEILKFGAYLLKKQDEYERTEGSW